MKVVEHAIAIAAEAHAGQVDRQGVPYIFHPLRVMESVRKAGLPDYAQAAAVLHDVVEDTALTVRDLWSRGVPYETMSLVEMLSHGSSEPYDDYIQSIIDSEVDEAVVIKYFDMRDNMLRIRGIDDEATQKRLTKKYAQNHIRLRQALPSYIELGEVW